jgi:hypothetical protein
VGIEDGEASVRQEPLDPRVQRFLRAMVEQAVRSLLVEQDEGVAVERRQTTAPTEFSPPKRGPKEKK